MTSHAGLPTQLTSFVGRRQEVAEVRRVLQRSRLVTITGIAGVGKTRVAIRAAQLTRRAFADGVVFVELPGVTGREALDQALVHALGIEDHAVDLVGHLAGRRLLLVLDTCEHLIEECSAFVQAVLRAAPGVHVLVTSRQALRAPGEHTVIVRPMALPGAEASTADLERTESVTLFLDRAAAADPGFELTPGNAATVAELCGRLEGVPLAIELAAVRVRSTPVERLLELLDAGQSAMGAALAWSSELCSQEERLLWERLTVFSGTFNLAAAEQVCADEELPGERVYPALAGLVEKSIIIRERDPGHTVYRMLDGVREFAAASLPEAAADRLRLRHREHYRALAQRMGAERAYPTRVEEWSRLRADWPNVRKALESDAANPQQIPIFLETVVRLWFLWVFAGMPRQGRATLERLLATGQGEPEWRMGARLLLTHICISQGDLPSARAVMEQVKAPEVFRPYAANMWGTLLYAEGDLGGAERHLKECLRTMGGQSGVVWFNALTVLGFTYVSQGRLDEGIEALTTAHTVCREHGEVAVAAWAEVGLALAMRLRGDLGQARRMARSALRDLAALRANFAIAFCVEILGWLAADRGSFAHAARLLSGAHNRWSAEVNPLFGSPLFTEERARYDTRLRNALGPRYERAVAAGRAMSVDELIAYALAADRGASESESRPTLEPLTRRETEVAELVADGLTNKTIAQKLVVAHRTVDTHLENILAKLGFSGRSQIAAWVSRRRRG